MFKVGRVCPGGLDEIAQRAEGWPLTYEAAGATLTATLPSGFRHDHYEVMLPDRPDAFRRAVDGLHEWAAHLHAGLAVQPRRPPLQGTTVAVATRLGPLTAVAVCRIVVVVDELDRYGFAYGTVRGHPECGEEAFVIERLSGRVTFKITAFSRPAEFLARAAGPVTRRIQQATSQRYLDGLVAFVSTSA